MDHHDLYDSRTSQSKGFTPKEIKKYQAQLERFIAQALPQSDEDVVKNLLQIIDRPAFRTRFQEESSLPRFKVAITESIAAINTGRLPDGTQSASKTDLRDPELRAALDGIVERLVALRAAYDDLLRRKEIQPCGCDDPECPVHMLSSEAVLEMDRRRYDLLMAVNELAPSFTLDFY